MVVRGREGNHTTAAQREMARGRVSESRSRAFCSLPTSKLKDTPIPTLLDGDNQSPPEYQSDGAKAQCANHWCQTQFRNQEASEGENDPGGYSSTKYRVSTSNCKGLDLRTLEASTDYSYRRVLRSGTRCSSPHEQKEDLSGTLERSSTFSNAVSGALPLSWALDF